MSYNSQKDVLIKIFEMKQDKGSLQFLVMSYNNGEPKLQITRMFNKSDGSVGYSKPGRFNKSEIEFLLKHSSEILELMNKDRVTI